MKCLQGETFMVHCTGCIGERKPGQHHTPKKTLILVGDSGYIVLMRQIAPDLFVAYFVCSQTRAFCILEFCTVT